MRAGLFAGSIAAIIAVLVSLPLHSPVDSAFNSATVAVAVLVLGVFTGLLWGRLNERLFRYVGVMAVLFLIVLVVAFIGEIFLNRFVSFVGVLAAIAFIVCTVLTPPLNAYFRRPDLGFWAWSPLVAALVALVLGFALITQGDAESGELVLPPPPTASAPSPEPTATSASQPTATAAATQVTAPTTESATTAANGAATTSASAEATPTVATGLGESANTFTIGDGSKVTFTVEEELGRAPVRFDAVISSTGLSGTARLDGQPSVVTLDLHSLESDQEFRDRYIQTRLFPDTPEAVVTVDQIPDLPQSFFDGEETTGTLSGSLQIGDTVTPLEFDVTARHDGSAINILGLTTFTWEQVGLPKPTARSVVYLADEVKVQVLLIATAP